MSLNFGKMDFAVSFNPMTAFPLDARSYYESLAAAEAAAQAAVEVGSAEGTVYFGQIVTVVENGAAQMFQVQPDGTLGEVGGKIEIDENQFVIDEETGKLNLYGFANAVAGAQLVVEEIDGIKSIKWVKPDTTTVDGLATAVADLETAQTAASEKITALETAVGKAAEGEEPASGLFADIVELEDRMNTAEGEIDTLEEDLGTLESLVGAPAVEGGAAASGVFAEIAGIETDIETINTALNQKANAADVYTKTEADNAIAVAVADAEHLKRKTFNTIAEAETFISGNPLTAEQYIYMIPVENGVNGDKYDEYMYIDNALERVGDWEVDLSDYALVSTVEDLSTEVDGVKESLNNYATTENVNAALALKADITTLDNYALISEVESDIALLATKEELNSLQTIVNGKVAAEEGKSLVANDEIAKLLTVEANAEKNFINSVEETQLKVEEEKLSIIGVDQALIGGLTNKAGNSDILVNILAEKANKADVDTAIADINTALGNKVDKVEGSRLITTAEANKLEALVIGEDGGVEISGTVNASNVQELYDAVVKIVNQTGYYGADNTEPLLGIEAGAQVNKIEAITLANGEVLPINEKIIDIPLATDTNVGVVKGSAAENKITVAVDGTMEVNSLNANKLVQTEGDYIILNGGNSSGEYSNE